MDHKGYTMLDENEESWSLEKLCTEDFHVDDLLDLGGIASDLEDHHEEEQEEDIHSSSTIASALSNHSPTLGDEPISVPEDDISDLEWVSHFVDDSVPFFPPPQQQLQENQRLHFLPNPTTAPGTSNSRTPSSPSVASISSPAVCAYPTLSRNFSSETFLVRCKTRTKRSRRVWSLSRPELGDPLCSSSSSCSSCSSASSSSCLVYEPHSLSPEVLPLVLLEGKATGRPPLHSNPEGKKKKKKGKKGKLAAAVLTAVAVEGGFGGRRCSHCGVQKTPQWRTGPMGAKTLCNACGVRYKSGRLLPEYRPACSPTFVSHVHSNSHRKVLELRREKEVLRLPSAAVVAAPSNVNFYSSG